MNDSMIKYYDEDGEDGEDDDDDDDEDDEEVSLNNKGQQEVKRVLFLSHA